MVEEIKRQRAVAVKVTDKAGDVAYVPVGPLDEPEMHLKFIGLLASGMTVEKVNVDLLDPDKVRDFTVYQLGPYQLLPADDSMIVEVADGE